MTSRLRKLLALPPAERRLLLAAPLVLCTVRSLLWIVPFDLLRRLLSRWTRPAPNLVTLGDRSRARIGKVVEVSSRWVPRASCLTQALTTQILLARAGQPSQLRIGVRKAEHGTFEAHAWLESGGHIVTGIGEIEHFVELGVARQL